MLSSLRRIMKVNEETILSQIEALEVLMGKKQIDSSIRIELQRVLDRMKETIVRSLHDR